MGVKFKTVKNDFPKMEAAIKNIDGMNINVGVFGEHAWLAGIHEYGCKIKVTDKMRAYLHSQGLHLKASTNVITIPERSFLRSGFDEHHVDVVNKAEKIIGDVIGGTLSKEQFAKTTGLLLASKIKNYATNLKSPPKHPFTAEQNPDKTNPLIMSGDMVGSINYEVE